MKSIIVGAALALPFVALGDTAETESRNKEIMRECNRLANEGDLKGQNACFADDLTFQGRPVKSQQLLAHLEDVFTTFPDYHSEIVDIIAEGDIVVTRNRVSGTHKGVGKLPVNGGMLIGVQPTGKCFEIQNIRWYKLRDGKIVEHNATRDDIGLTRQLGLLPESPQKPTS